MLHNPPQLEDADILEEPNASAADDAVRAAGAGTVLVESGDSEDSGPFRMKRSHPESVEDHDAIAAMAPPADPSPSSAAPKRNQLARLWRVLPAQSG